MSKLGSYCVDRNQIPLSDVEREIVDRFHKLYYERWLAGGDTINLSWLGYQILKCPLDLWVYQELIVRNRPDLVIEAGTYRGGSALYIASILDLLGNGELISIDLEPRADRPEHPRITYMTGSSTDPTIVGAVHQRAGGRRVMVILDSDHHADHVYRELQLYSPVVAVGDYLIVEDTNINGHPTFAAFGPGPMEAVDRFLQEDDQFEPDARCERFLMTLQPKGYLKRIKPPRPASAV